jgi:hypothetical protein
MHPQRFTYGANPIGIASFGAALPRGQGDRKRIVVALHLIAVEQGMQGTTAARRNDAIYGRLRRRSCEIRNDRELPEDEVVLFFKNKVASCGDGVAGAGAAHTPGGEVATTGASGCATK